MSPAKTLARRPLAQSTDASAPVEERQVIHGATWDFYDRLTDALAKRAPFRVAYDGNDIEIMTLGPKHERSKALLDLFIEYVSAGLAIDCEALGSTTWKRSELGRGIEADLCYYFDALKLEACAAADALDSNDVADYPNPDLAVEVDLSPSKIDRPGIYRALQVPEVWRLDAGTVSIEQLGADGNYVAAESSRFLHVRADEVTRWVFKEKSLTRRQWKKRLQDWVLAELRPRIEAAGDNK
jgi:Uma2 family endonuclease